MASLGLLVVFVIATLIVVSSLVALALVPTWPMLVFTLLIHGMMSALVIGRIGKYANIFDKSGPVAEAHADTSGRR